ncbi:hypothetical protein SPIROBIBN47_10017 [uncultured spirochete]|uniref:Uncharacterized protein n=1 Tax=uncultured spirochete TaxID=156406 RepID=A0A3P3XF76_9SPIR|nr:hypothetical protein SPIROBIBN47_10017 [uncultured spirochete]
MAYELDYVIFHFTLTREKSI